MQVPVKIDGRNMGEGEGNIILDGQFTSLSSIPEMNTPTGLAFSTPAVKVMLRNIQFRKFPINVYLNGMQKATLIANRFSSDGVNQSSVLGESVQDFRAYKNTFTPTATDINGISLINPTDNVKISCCTFVGFSDTTTTTNGNGIYLLFNTSSTLPNAHISRCVFTNFSNPFGGLGGNGVLVDFEVRGHPMFNSCASQGASSQTFRVVP